MHILTRHIVFADSEAEAKSKAEENAQNMTGYSGQPFDWFNMEGDRWEDSGKVFKADSKKGKELIEKGMEFTYKELREDYDKVKEAFDTKTFEEIVENENMVRYYAYCFGKYSGMGVYLYDHKGEGIRSKKDLESAKKGWDSKEFNNLTLYVVPIDMHN